MTHCNIETFRKAVGYDAIVCTCIEVNTYVTVLKGGGLVEDDGTVLAPLCSPRQDGVLLGVWLHEINIEVTFSPQLTDKADGIQGERTHGIICKSSQTTYGFIISYRAKLARELQVHVECMCTPMQQQKCANSKP